MSFISKKWSAYPLGSYSGHQGIFWVVISAIGFSTLAIFGKVFYAHGVSPMSILLWRFGLSAILIWSWLLFKKCWKISKQQGCTLILLGGVGMAIQALLFFSSLKVNTASVASLFLYTYPAFVVLLAWWICKELPKVGHFVALMFAMIGCIFTLDVWGHPSVKSEGSILGLASGAWYAMYIMVSTQWLKQISPLVVAGYTFLGATLSFLLLSFMTDDPVLIPFNVSMISAVVGITVLATVIPFVTFFLGIQKIGAPVASLVSTFEPVSTVFLGIFLLGDRLILQQWVGGACILVSVLILKRMRSQAYHLTPARGNAHHEALLK